MKGKVAFVLGAAVGYVLGTRAGRERYEQIKRGAERLWNTTPVQRGVGAVRGIVDDRLDDAKVFIRRASADAFANFARQAEANADAKTDAKTGAPEAKPDSTKSKPAAESAKPAAAKAKPAAAKTKPRAAKPRSQSGKSTAQADADKKDEPAS